MPLPVELHPAALQEATDARQWYADRSPRAALRFMAELDIGIEAIGEHPLRWPTHLHDTRRYRLRRFPYLLVYRLTESRVELIACQHAHRKPGYWRDRL